jgi:hypothetical protein
MMAKKHFSFTGNKYKNQGGDERPGSLIRLGTEGKPKNRLGKTTTTRFLQEYRVPSSVTVDFPHLLM